MAANPNNPTPQNPTDRVDYLFSINAGRSGSHYLTQLLAHGRDVTALHEPDPAMQRREMEAWNRGNQKPLRDLFPSKLARMHQCVGIGQVYAETNNAFVKGFGHLVAESLPHQNVGVIILRRDLEHTVESILARGYLPHQPEGRKWMLRPDAKTNLLKAPNPRRATDREMVRWYVQEVYVRGEAFRQLYPNMRYFDIHLDTLNDINTVKRMFAFFGIEVLPSLAEVVGTPTNTQHRPAVAQHTEPPSEHIHTSTQPSVTDHSPSTPKGATNSSSSTLPRLRIAYPVDRSILFSVLIPSLPSRLSNRLAPLLDKLHEQVGDRKDVEILSFLDNKMRSVGYKRDSLVQIARGRFLAFVDDDDDVADDYVKRICDAIDSDPHVDVIVFNQEVRVNNGPPFTVRFGLEYPNERAKQNPDGSWRDIRRSPFHVCAWRSDLAKTQRFSDASYGEDWDWVQRLLPAARRQTRIDRILHSYFYDDAVTEAEHKYPDSYDKAYARRGWLPW